MSVRNRVQSWRRPPPGLEGGLRAKRADTDESQLHPRSLWWETLGTPVVPRTPLDGDTTCDVAIVGAGYTGLWTAHYLAESDRAMRIVVLEREVAGFGASGRNGGWCSNLFATSYSRIAATDGVASARAMHAAMSETVDEVGRAATELGIDCHYSKGGTVSLARNVAQLERARLELGAARRLGLGEDDLELVDAERARREVGATEVLGALVNPHCAAIHPARLVRGLASSIDKSSVSLCESTTVTRIEPHRVRTDRGTVRAEVVVRATEGYTPGLRNMHRAVAPVYSLMIATEPLGADFWESAGIGRRQTFSDMRHLIVYGQRTADDRIAFGGRGAPYHFGSGVDASFDSDLEVHAQVQSTLGDLFPALRHSRITHRWGGPLGITRDWHPSVGLDRRSGLAWAGGYAGDGVATANLAGRTLRDLILGYDSGIVRLPWVDHRSPRWEPEPLRWMGINAALKLASGADRAEARSGRPSRRAAILERLTGE